MATYFYFSMNCGALKFFMSFFFSLYKVSMLSKKLADDVLKYFSDLSQKIGFDISCKLSHRRQFACNVKAYLLGKNRKNIINLFSADSAQRLVKVYGILKFYIMMMYFYFSVNYGALKFFFFFICHLFYCEVRCIIT